MPSLQNKSVDRSSAWRWAGGWWVCAARFLKPFPISDQNLRFCQPYFRPDQNVDTLFQLLHGWRNNLRLALLTVLSPNNDEDVSSKKTYPIQDLSEQTIPHFKPIGQNRYPISDQNG